MAKKEVTNDEIMQALGQFAGQMDERFDAVDERFDKLESDVAELKSDVAELKVNVVELKSDVAELKSDVTELKSDVNRIYGILDKHMARIEQLIEENSVQTHQQERLQRWIFQLADQANIKLRYDA